MKPFAPRDPESGVKVDFLRGSALAPPKPSGEGSPRPIVALRRFRVPIPARVRVEEGRPVRVWIDRRGYSGGQIAVAAGPWRTSGAWWDVTSSTAWDRDEWDAALSDGSVCRLFHDRIADRWFLDGILD